MVWELYFDYSNSLLSVCLATVPWGRYPCLVYGPLLGTVLGWMMGGSDVVYVVPSH